MEIAGKVIFAEWARSSIPEEFVEVSDTSTVAA
jgi:hypothetical protein